MLCDAVCYYVRHVMFMSPVLTACLPQVVMGGAGGVVPSKVLGENTLVLSDDAVICSRNGRPYLMFRCARAHATP
jgi:hypothetical protein